MKRVIAILLSILLVFSISSGLITAQALESQAQGSTSETNEETAPDNNEEGDVIVPEEPFVIEGVVTNSQGKPLEFVNVNLTDGFDVIGTTITGKDGYYYFDVVEGSYGLSFEAENFWKASKSSIEVDENVTVDAALVDKVTIPSLKRGAAVSKELITNSSSVKITAGTLPNGLTISSKGLLSGTPSQTGSFTIEVSAVSGGFNVVTDYELVVGKSSNANLSGIKINNSALGGFAPNVTSYNYLLKVGSTINKDSVVVTKACEYSSVETKVSADKIEIFVTAEDGTKRTYTVNIEHEKIPVSKIEVPSKNIRLLEGREQDLKYEILPKNTTDVVSWSVVDKKVATLEDGVITAQKKGKTTIQAKDQKGKVLIEIVIEVFPVGDVNLDGRVDINDAILVLRHVVGEAKLSGFGLTAGDVNFDGSININDAILVLRHIVGDANLDNPPSASPPITIPLSGKVIMLDPGHGGADPGAVAHGYTERLLNDQLSAAIAKELRAAGATVLFTREPFNNVTLPMADRIPIINNSGADIFISVHHDGSSNQSVRGASAFYSTYRPAVTTDDIYVLWNGKKYPWLGEIDTSNGGEGGYIINDNGTRRELRFSTGARAYSSNPSVVAENSIILANKLYQALIDTGLQRRSAPYDTNYYMTRWPNMPAVLIEAGFVSNRDDVRIAADPKEQEKRARFITEAIIDYFNEVDKK